jgi:hypothetical protein
VKPSICFAMAQLVVSKAGSTNIGSRAAALSGQSQVD